MRTDGIGDLAGVLPELIDVYVAHALEAIKHLVKSAKRPLCVCTVGADIAQAAYLVVVHIGQALCELGADVVEVDIFHLRVEDPERAVGALAHVYLYHVGAVLYGYFICRHGVAGNVSAAGAAVSHDYYPLGGIFFNVECCHWICLSYLFYLINF